MRKVRVCYDDSVLLGDSVGAHLPEDALTGAQRMREGRTTCQWSQVGQRVVGRGSACLLVVVGGLLLALFGRRLPATAAVPTEEAYEQKLQEVKNEVGAGFHGAVEEPFIVVSDQSRRAFERSRRQTIRWGVRLLKKDFFDRDPDTILTIYLFDGKKSYRKHAKRLFGDDPDTPFGYYSSFDEALVMNIATGGGTLVHELVHPFMEANFPNCPAWFNEGLGSLFEQCHERRGHIAGLLNWRLEILKDGIRQGHYVPLENLLATSTGEFYADSHGMHYAEARYLLYYVQQQGKLRDYYRAFVSNAKKDPSGIQTLCTVMGFADLRELERQWLAFIDTLRTT